MSRIEEWSDSELERARAMRAALGALASRNRSVAVRAPGRVNLIGEHTDYSGLPVLPIAIDRSTIVVAAARSDSRVTLSNVDSTYAPREFSLEAKIPPYPAGDWANYVKAAVQGVIDHFARRGVDVHRRRGVAMRFDSAVPSSAGLSSSAALTVAATLAFMSVNELELAPIETASMVARSEWYVGTMAGGMDQAASILGARDHALFIEFNPLRVRRVAMPPDAALVVADSLEVADKSGRVREEYNRRVVECRIAARILSRALHVDGARILGDIVARVPDWDANELVNVLRDAAPERLSGGIAQAAGILEMPEAQLRGELLGDDKSNPVRIDEGRPLEIIRRARHVLTETERVVAAAQALSVGDLSRMGELMNASHQSLRDDFGASTARLDAMVECARSGGALGARLTGAGFGGCMIALAQEANAPQLIDALRRGYYAKIENSSNALCGIVRAGAGASVIDLSP
ncbi:MAG TPA: galactokinase [Candidatus Binataceae bacterium]|nr:galactokinase [Candidatus Binataceae bacterium]